MSSKIKMVSLSTERLSRCLLAGALSLSMLVAPIPAFADEEPAPAPAPDAPAQGGDGAGEGDAPAQGGPVADEAGWLEGADGSWYYFERPGDEPAVGWALVGGSWYYLDPADGGRMLTGKFSDGSASYVCDPSGAMVTGWARVGGEWYYAGASGALAGGWQRDGGSWYWLDPATRAMATGWAWDGSAWYLMGGSGAMLTGWQRVGGDWYYLRPSGAMATGWLLDGGAWYWLRPSGAMAAGGVESVGGALYSFGASGAMASDAVVDLGGGEVGYASSSGAIARVGTREGGAVVLRDAQGRPLAGWQQFGGAWFYGGPGGVAHTGWLDLGGTWYWMDADGVMATGARTIDGKTYVFASSGAWLPVSEAHAAVYARALREVELCTDPSMTKEQKLWAAYVHIRDDFPEYNPRVPHMRASGWETIYADDIFVGRGGNCLSYAAALAFMAKAIGYENVYACNWGHGWAEIDGLVYDPEWEKNHRSESYFARPIHAPGGPGYTDRCPADSPWHRVAI